MANHLPPIILQTGKLAQHSIIWLHGLGADGQDFVPIADELELPVAVRYIFPHAPMRPVTINGGFVMRAWYDIAGQDMDAQQDAAGIRASLRLGDELLQSPIADPLEILVVLQDAARAWRRRASAPVRGAARERACARARARRRS